MTNEQVNIALDFFELKTRETSQCASRAASTKHKYFGSDFGSSIAIEYWAT